MATTDFVAFEISYDLIIVLRYIQKTVLKIKIISHRVVMVTPTDKQIACNFTRGRDKASYTTSQ